MMELERKIRTINLDGEEINLDPEALSFNDATLNKFMEGISLWYDYYSSKTALAEEIFVRLEGKYESKKAEKFMEGSSQGLSVKAAEAYATTDIHVDAAKELMDKAKSNLKQMKEFLKSLDKAHDMAQNRGYMLRKEMDKLHTDIYPSRSGNQINVDDIIGKCNVS